MKFQVKFYDIIDHNKCPSSKKSAEKCILRNSYFHHSEPSYTFIELKVENKVIVRILLVLSITGVDASRITGGRESF